MTNYGSLLIHGFIPNALSKTVPRCIDTLLIYIEN